MKTKKYAMVTKKLISLVLTMLMISSLLPLTAQAAVEVKLASSKIESFENSDIKITGTFVNMNGTVESPLTSAITARLRVFRPGKTSADLAGITDPAALLDVIEYIKVFSTNANGTFEISFRLRKDAIEGEHYTVELAAIGVSLAPVETAKFMYFKTDIDQFNYLLTDIDADKIDTMYATLDSLKDTLGISLTEGNRFGMIMSGASDASNKAAADRVFLKVAQAKDDFVGSGTPEEQIEALKKALKDAFYAQTAVEAVNLATVSQLENIFEANKDYIKAELGAGSDFSKLSAEQKTSLWQALLRKDKPLRTPFAACAEIKEAFDDEVDALLNEEPAPSSKPKNDKDNSTRTVTYTPVDPGVYPTPSPESVNFVDVPNDHWAAASIKALAKDGVIVGSGDRFRPNDNVTREEFIKILIEAFGLVDETATADFSDVSSGEWYYKYIASASKLGISKGQDNGTFGIGRNITRQEMAVLLYRVAGYVQIELPQNSPEIIFADADTIDDYAKAGIAAIQKSGIVKGVGDNRFAPSDNATRAMAAQVVYLLRALKK